MTVGEYRHHLAELLIELGRYDDAIPVNVHVDLEHGEAYVNIKNEAAAITITLGCTDITL